jgi:hypothetical protein
MSISKKAGQRQEKCAGIDALLLLVANSGVS